MGNCNGNCGSCSGCARELVLTEKEIVFLRDLGQIPFLPVARKMGDLTPVYLEDDCYNPEEYSLILIDHCYEGNTFLRSRLDRMIKTSGEMAVAGNDQTNHFLFLRYFVSIPQAILDLCLQFTVLIIQYIYFVLQLYADMSSLILLSCQRLNSTVHLVDSTKH